jgi:oligopeptide/dipeptide ABC transporter ATP-binding protein
VTSPIIEVSNLAKVFASKQGAVRAFQDVSFSIAAGETLALVGESGCGKTSLAKTIYRLLEPDAGEIRLAGFDISHLSRRRMKPLRSMMQMVFQDPYASLNPRSTVKTIIGEPLIVHGIGNASERAKIVESLLNQVGLPADAAQRYPHQFSGGQRQRIGIARALALKPKVMICDEPVSALDISIQAQILNLLADIQQSSDLSMLFISHDLGIVRHMADRIMVMYLGKIVETGNAEALWGQPTHPYTRALLNASPIPDPDIEAQRDRTVLKGDLPSPYAPPSGCAFHPRCPIAVDLCRTSTPALRDISGGRRSVACHLAPDVPPKVDLSNPESTSSNAAI